MDLNTPNQIRDYFQTIQERHTEISHFVYGNVRRLEQLFHKQVKKGEYVLYIEWPQKRYRDQDGSIDVKYITGISVLTAVNQQDDTYQDAALDKCHEIYNDIVIRMREEMHERNNIFQIQDMTIIDPVFNYLVDNCFGVRNEIEPGDWVSITVDVNKWTDK